MIEAISNLHFLRPAWLLLAPVAVFIWWLWKRRADSLRGWREQMDPDLLKALVVGDGSRRGFEGAGWLAGTLLATLAVAGPTWRLEPSPFAADAQPLMILLKASESMLTADPPPTRLERAQLKIADLAAAREGQPMGLIVYAGSAHLVLPPTRDTDIVAEMAAEIRPDIMPAPGDRLDLALRRASELLRDSGEGGTLLVVADSIDAVMVADAKQDTGPFPTQILSLATPDTPETKSVAAAARSLGARVTSLSIDDRDIEAIASFAESKLSAGVQGESDRWQEAGYWLSPLVALIVALSFRRVALADSGAPS